jgi:hypothetical protein
MRKDRICTVPPPLIKNQIHDTRRQSQVSPFQENFEFSSV